MDEVREGGTIGWFNNRHRPKRVPEPCIVETCGKPEYALGLCNPHYQQFNTYGRITQLKTRPRYKGILCKAEGCERQAKSLGYCRTHYVRFKKYGDAYAHIPFSFAPNSIRKAIAREKEIRRDDGSVCDSGRQE